MEEIEHLWNITKLLSKSVDSDSIRTHYVECCRRLGDHVELPNKIFGPAVMCTHCGSPWSLIEHRVRLAPGRAPSSSIEKLMAKTGANHVKLPRIKRTLIEKCSKNRANNVIVTCSVCSMDTKITLEKPPRRKLPKINYSVSTNPGSGKKRKKRTKDKTAGLNITGMKSSGSQDPKSSNRTGSGTNANTPKRLISSTLQVKRKKNNVNKLQGILNKHVTPSKKSMLHSFIMEL